MINTKEFSFTGLWWIVLCLFAIYQIADYATPKDSTDPVDGRSGFKIMVDSKNGCQYLQSGIFGGLSPRYDKYGKQICGEYE